MVASHGLAQAGQPRPLQFKVRAGFYQPLGTLHGSIVKLVTLVTTKLNFVHVLLCLGGQTHFDTLPTRKLRGICSSNFLGTKLRRRFRGQEQSTQGMLHCRAAALQEDVDQLAWVRVALFGSIIDGRLVEQCKCPAHIGKRKRSSRIQVMHLFLISVRPGLPPNTAFITRMNCVAANAVNGTIEGSNVRTSIKAPDMCAAM
mmetsp:Transcript_86542/g.166577  ORF Transcript_86542/g.166577 Transcript_86542/m.166577 type:complete len:201 (-) Transcript_86542:336-938(-)